MTIAHNIRTNQKSSRASVEEIKVAKWLLFLNNPFLLGYESRDQDRWMLNGFLFSTTPLMLEYEVNAKWLANSNLDLSHFLHHLWGHMNILLIIKVKFYVFIKRSFISSLEYAKY